MVSEFYFCLLLIASVVTVLCFCSILVLFFFCFSSELTLWCSLFSEKTSSNSLRGRLDVLKVLCCCSDFFYLFFCFVDVVFVFILLSLRFCYFFRDLRFLPPQPRRLLSTRIILFLWYFGARWLSRRWCLAFSSFFSRGHALERS